MAKEILRLSTDEEYYQKIAAQCQNRAAKYDIGKMVEQHISLYKSVLEE